MPPKVKKCHFQNEWLTNEENSNWVQAVQKNRPRVKCSTDCKNITFRSFILMLDDS